MKTSKPTKAGRTKLIRAKRTLTAAQLFFFEHAGYCYNPKEETAEQGRIRGAVELAAAEQHAQEQGWEYRWEYDNDVPYEDALGDHEYWCDDARQENEHTHEILSCQLVDAEGTVLESLGAIIDPDHNYRRVIEAELADEHIAYLRKRTAGIADAVRNMN